MTRQRVCKLVDTYLVTGVDHTGKKFCRTFYNFRLVNSINPWRGRVFHITKDSKRRLIKQVYN